LADERLDYVLAAFTWRITASAPPWDFAQIVAELDSYDDWCRVWSRWAARHAACGDAAAAAGRGLTAADAYVRAGLFYHWASFLFTERQDEFRAAVEALDAVWAKAAPHVGMELVEVDGSPGYLRRPTGARTLAVVLPGVDSTKEEFFGLTTELVKRGVAAFAVDAHGQGSSSLRRSMEPPFEPAVRAVVDRFAGEFDRIVVGGMSYGGTFALRAAAQDDRIAACFAVSSGYSAAGRYERFHPLTQAGLRHYMAGDPAEMERAITVEGIRVGVPVLQVYGGQDRITPVADAQRVADELGGPVETVVLQDGVHVCNNVWYALWPLVAQWVADRS
jgi:alpha-beta hydrolase superfamily lysophospholipase